LGVSVAADLSGVARSRCEAGGGGEAVWAAELLHGADSGDDLGAEEGADGGHAGHDFGRVVTLKGLLDLRIDLQR
jgi:hypothetical protein